MRKCGHELQGALGRDGVGVSVTELDVEAVRIEAEVGIIASGAGEGDGKAFARRGFKIKSCKWLIQARTTNEKCRRSFAEAGVQNWK